MQLASLTRMRSFQWHHGGSRAVGVRPRHGTQKQLDKHMCCGIADPRESGKVDWSHVEFRPEMLLHCGADGSILQHKHAQLQH